MLRDISGRRERLRVSGKLLLFQLLTRGQRRRIRFTSIFNDDRCHSQLLLCVCAQVDDKFSERCRLLSTTGFDHCHHCQQLGLIILYAGYSIIHYDFFIFNFFSSISHAFIVFYSRHSVSKQLQSRNRRYSK